MVVKDEEEGYGPLYSQQIYRGVGIEPYYHVTSSTDVSVAF